MITPEASHLFTTHHFLGNFSQDFCSLYYITHQTVCLHPLTPFFWKKSWEHSI